MIAGQFMRRFRYSHASALFCANGMSLSSFCVIAIARSHMVGDVPLVAATTSYSRMNRSEMPFVSLMGRL